MMLTVIMQTGLKTAPTMDGEFIIVCHLRILALCVTQDPQVEWCIHHIVISAHDVCFSGVPEVTGLRVTAFSDTFITVQWDVSVNLSYIASK